MYKDLIFLIIFVLLFICNFFGKLPLNSISVKDIDIIYINEKNRNEGFITNDPNFKNLKKIDKSYFINLDRSVKRLEYLKDQCKKNNIQIKRVSAVDGSKLDKNFVDKVKKNKNADWHMIKGELGCYLSHCKIWNLFKNSNDKIITILEDDINFDKTFLYKLDLAMKELPNDWDILLIGFRPHHKKSCESEDSKHCILNYSKQLNKIRSHWYGTHGYLLNRKSLDKILKKCETKNLLKPIDLVMSDFYIDGLNIYAPKQEIVSSYSHTTNNIDYSQIMNAANIEK